MQALFAIWDAAPQAYLEPFFSMNEATATRAFAECANDTEHNFYRHAADLTLFKIADWDMKTGELTVLKAKEPLGCALQFIAGTAPRLVQDNPLANGGIIG